MFRVTPKVNIDFTLFMHGCCACFLMLRKKVHYEWMNEYAYLRYFVMFFSGCYASLLHYYSKRKL